MNHLYTVATVYTPCTYCYIAYTNINRTIVEITKCKLCWCLLRHILVTQHVSLIIALNYLLLLE